MKYIIEPIHKKLSRLIIQWKPSHGTVRRPSIMRHAIEANDKLNPAMGSVIGYDLNRPCALVLNVRRGDLVSIRSRIVGTSIAEWSHVQITADFEVVASRAVNR